VYTVRGRTAATAANANDTIAQLWNPSSSQRLRLIQFGLIKNAAGTAGDSFRLRRTSARGTAGSTVTPGQAHHSIFGVAPVSGALLDLAAFTVQPTLVAGELGPDWIANSLTACGLHYPIPGGIEIPPGAGLALVQAAATIWPISGVTFVWLEDR